MQDMVQVDKDAAGHVTQRNVMGVMYVPLTDKEAQVGRTRHFR